jgi:hypothetical protein
LETIYRKKPSRIGSGRRGIAPTEGESLRLDPDRSHLVVLASSSTWWRKPTSRRAEAVGISGAGEGNVGEKDGIGSVGGGLEHEGGDLVGLEDGHVHLRYLYGRKMYKVQVVFCKTYDHESPT